MFGYVDWLCNIVLLWLCIGVGLHFGFVLFWVGFWVLGCFVFVSFVVGFVDLFLVGVLGG